MVQFYKNRYNLVTKHLVTNFYYMTILVTNLSQIFSLQQFWPKIIIIEGKLLNQAIYEDYGRKEFCQWH